MFWSTQWYGTISWIAFVLFIVAFLYVEFDLNSVKNFVRETVRDIKTFAVKELFLTFIQGVLMVVFLPLYAAVAAVFWPLSVPLVFWRVRKTYRERHSMSA